MKKLLYTLLISGIFILNCYAQGNKPISKNMALFTATNKTSFLIFPNPIDFFNFGDSGAIQVIAAENQNNILLMHAVKPNFQETNLTVLLKNGKLYSFVVNYKSSPEVLNYIFSENEPNIIQYKNISSTAPQILNEQNDPYKGKLQNEDSDFNVLASKLLLDSKKYNNLNGVKDNGVIFALRNIYIKDNKFYFVLQFSNTSDVNYEVDFLKFFVRNKKGLKMRTLQDVELPIKQSFPDITQLVNINKTLQEFVIEMDKFTIDKTKALQIEIWEMGGDRTVGLAISSTQLLRAKRWLKEKRR